MTGFSGFFFDRISRYSGFFLFFLYFAIVIEAGLQRQKERKKQGFRSFFLSFWLCALHDSM
ncbi:MAG: hypothetical protein EAZ44_00430 [Cytophagia bacterium]|nr:MAG: hypothetical protein EAZ44_00430 [Cytophagia bacterium]